MQGEETNAHDREGGRAIRHSRCFPARSEAGAIVGQTDELGFNSVEDRAHVHDIHATILHLLGLDHKKLTFRFQGRDFRLTDVHGELLTKLLA